MGSQDEVKQGAMHEPEERRQHKPGRWEAEDGLQLAIPPCTLGAEWSLCDLPGVKVFAARLGAR